MIGLLAACAPDPSQPGTTIDDDVYTAVAVGAQSACAIRADGTLACWGLAAGDAPVGAAAIAVDLEYFGGCAVMGDGSPECWGDPERFSPETALPPGGDYLAVGLGQMGACWLVASGELLCAGRDEDWGEFPGDAPDGEFTSVTGGVAHMCALGADGALACWGEDGGSWGHLPERSWVAVDAGYYSTCAIDTDGGAFCSTNDEMKNLDGGGPRSREYEGRFSTVRADGHYPRLTTDGGLAFDYDGYCAVQPGAYVDAATWSDVICALPAEGGIRCWVIENGGEDGPYTCTSGHPADLL